MMNPQASEQLPFFVYGTLLPNQPNFGLWGSFVIESKTAFLDNSQIFDMGYYPMLVAGLEGRVTGKLITIDRLVYDKILARIDSLEEYDPDQVDQSTYRRVCRGVRLTSGEKVDAWVYEGDIQSVNGSRQIISGDWQDYVRDRQAEILNWWQAIDTLFGHHK